MDFEREYYTSIYEYTVPQERLRIQRSYLSLIRSMVGPFKNILDIGCSYGDFLRICDQEGYETYGIEVSKFAIEQAANNTKGKIYNIDISRNKTPFPSNYFDVVTCFDVLEHLQEASCFLKEVYRILAKEGLLFCTTPNGSSIFRHIFPDRDPTHINTHDQIFWRGVLSDIGFKRVRIKGCLVYGFPPSQTIRQKLQRFHIPTVIKPIFLPIFGLAGGLFIFARK